jgi:ribulose 1,5-bisphosphate carboxylase large subunit-like protein
LRQAWDAVRAGVTLADYAQQAPELRHALHFFNGR